MSQTVRYLVTFASNLKGNYLHIHPCEYFIACVKAVEDSETFHAYHQDNGKHLTPDYAAIRAAIPHYHRKAFDRAGKWWFPRTLRSALTGELDQLNAASLTLNDSKGRLLGTLYATPYLSSNKKEQEQ